MQSEFGEDSELLLKFVKFGTKGFCQNFVLRASLAAHY